MMYNDVYNPNKKRIISRKDSHNRGLLQYTNIQFKESSS